MTNTTPKLLIPFYQSAWDDLTIDCNCELGEVALDLIIAHLVDGDTIPKKLHSKKKFVEYLNALTVLYNTGVCVS